MKMALSGAASLVDELQVGQKSKFLWVTNHHDKQWRE